MPWGEPRPGGLGQRISRGAAWLSYAGALTCLFALGYTTDGLGADHPVAASLAAAAVFFISAGLVLHVMGLVNLPNLRFDRTDEPPPGA